MREHRKEAQFTEEWKSSQDGREPEHPEESDRRCGRQGQIRQSPVAHRSDLSGF